MGKRMNSWCRLWHDMPTDPKFRAIARRAQVGLPDVLSVFLLMLTCASQAEERGTLEGWDDEDAAAALDLDAEVVSAIRDAMQGKLMDGNRLTGWDKRQPQRERDDAQTSTERVREHRARRAGATPLHEDATAEQRHVTPCNTMKHHETPPDTDTDTDTDADAEYITTAIDDRRQTSTHRVHTQHRDDPPEPAPPRGRGVPNDAPKHVPLATMPHPDTPVSRVSRRHGRESAKNLVEAILHEADRDPQRQHWRDAIVAAESAANPARPDAWRLQVLRNWLAGDGTPPPPVPAGQSIAISAISPHPPPMRQRLTVVEERIAAGEAVIDRAIQAMQDQIDRERAIATIPILEVAHG